MDLMLIELVLWGGLLFLFWALKDGLGGVESDIESLGIAKDRLLAADGYINPEEVSERIGTYRDKAIYRYAVIDGRNYRYDGIRPLHDERRLRENERCLEPGLIYVPCNVDHRDE